MQTNDFKNKRIFISGINGFVGSHLAKKLYLLGAKVYGMSRTGKGENILTGNIIEYTTVRSFIKKNKISICFHLAAEALVEKGQINPYQTFKINTLGTLNILEIARESNFEKVIIASTSHVYGNNPVPYEESYPPKPSRPYETSKTCTDLIAQSYADSFHLPVLIPRFVNIYGPGDLHFNRLIPKTIKSLLEGMNPTMWGNNAVRDYLYIDDAIDAYLALASADISKVGENRVFNVGSNTRLSVQELIELLIRISDKKYTIKKVPAERQDEIQAQYVSWRKIANTLQWKPRVRVEEGFKKTFAWYKEYMRKC